MAHMVALDDQQLTETHPTVLAFQPRGRSREGGVSLTVGLGRSPQLTCPRGPGGSAGLRPAGRPGQHPQTPSVHVEEGRWACWLHPARKRPFSRDAQHWGLKTCEIIPFHILAINAHKYTAHIPPPHPAQVSLRKQHRKGHLRAGRLGPRADAGPSVRGVSSRVLAGYLSSIVVTEQLCKPFLCWRCLLLQEPCVPSNQPKHYFPSLLCSRG